MELKPHTNTLFAIQKIVIPNTPQVKEDDGCEACQHCLLWRKWVLTQIAQKSNVHKAQIGQLSAT